MKTKRISIITLIASGLFLTLATTVTVRSADESEGMLKPAYPERYTVIKGDTLWDIANRFLKDPWRWPVIWQQNESIQNPHLIYPGDVLVLTRIGDVPRLRVLRMEPKVREEPLEDAITTIPAGAIAPFLDAPLVVNQDDLENAAHVVVGVEDNIVLGNLSRFFARGLPNGEHEYFHVFRPGGIFTHPESNEILGYEAIFLGDARVLEHGETARMEVIEAKQEIEPRDRLLPAKETIGLPHYFPHAPDNDVHGWIIHAPGGVAEMGKYDIVVISLGEYDGIEPGHVLRVRRHRGEYIDPVTNKPIELPADDSGLVMVFRTFEKVSYALIMKGNRPIHVMDQVENP